MQTPDKSNKPSKTYKSYRVEATPISNIFYHIIAMSIILQMHSVAGSGQWLSFKQMWPWGALLGVVSYYLIMWIKYKNE